MKITDFFDGVYCINLDGRTDRWETAQKEFDKLDITDQVVRWSGTVHEDGNIGCTLSHLSIIKHCKEKGYKNVLIFEDDVLFLGDDMNKLEKTFHELFELGNWDLFYLGSTIQPNIGEFIRVTDNILKTNFAYTTHAYAVNEQAFDPMIEAWERGVKNGKVIVDVSLCEEIVRGRKKSFVMDPIYAIQQPGVSDISNVVADSYEWMVTFFNDVKSKMK
jgi:GR25 family glycosyltransferase involved in LPS biosynthesis